MLLILFLMMVMVVVVVELLLLMMMMVLKSVGAGEPFSVGLSRSDARALQNKEAGL